MTSRKLSKYIGTLERATIDLIYATSDLEDGAKGTKQARIAASVVFHLVAKISQGSGGGRGAPGKRAHAAAGTASAEARP